MYRGRLSEKQEATRRWPGKPEFPGQRQYSGDKPRSGKSWSLVPELWKSMRTNSALNRQDMDRRASWSWCAEKL